MKTQLFILILSLFVSKSTLRGQVVALPPGSVVAGLSVEEWSAEWWKWQLALQTPVSPTLDTNGYYAHVNQAGPVFFLGGGTGTGGMTNYITRTVAISTNKYIFFPIINWTAENVGRAVPLSPQELRDEAFILTTAVHEARASVDGVAVPVSRLMAPIFSYTTPNISNIFQYLSLDVPGGVTDPAAADGYWVMLEPLSPGPHVVQFRGVAGDPFNLGFDVTYYLTVRKLTLSERVSELIKFVRDTRFPPKRQRSLLAALTEAKASFDRNKVRPGIQHLSTFVQKASKELGKDDPLLAGLFVRVAEDILDQAKGESK
jgi:hypothetical protein